MPFAIPLIIAVGAAAAGITTGVVAGLMIAGGALTAIGGLTGDKNLMTFGSVLGLAGGVTGLASGAADAAASQVATQAATDGSTAALSQTVAPGAQAIENQAAASVAASNVVQPGAQAIEAGAQQGIIAGQQTAPALAAPEASLASTPTAANPASNLASSTPAAGTPATPADTWAANGPGEAANTTASGADPFKPMVTADATPAVTAPTTAAGPTAAGPTGAQAIEQAAGIPGSPALTAADKLANGASATFNQLKNAASGAVDWVGKNPEMAKIGAGIIGGAANNASKQKQIQMQYDLEWEQAQKRRAQYNASLTGLKMPTYVPPKA